MAQRILIIVTSNARMGEHAKPTGLWAEELAVPYYALLDAGAEVEIASPRGGQVPLDPGSLKPAGQNDPAVERLLADPVAMDRLAHSRVVAELDASRFDAVFFPGGHGTMWDLPLDAGVTRAVEAAFAADKVIAAVCHGPAGLVTARRPDGQSILAGRRVNGFTDAEEAAAGLDQVVPFKLESRMRELGGRFESGPLWQPYAVTDGRLVTGQNPASSRLVAEHTLALLGLAAAPAAAG